MKAIMYHYVRPYENDLPFLKSLDIEDFLKQLDFFEKQFGFVSKKDFVESFTTGIIPKGVVLTFDDGLKCHYKYIFKELKKRNLWGIFYISTLQYQTNKILDVHRIHLLLGMHKSIVVYNELMKIVSEDMMPDRLKKEFKELTYINQVNDETTKLIKRILNYYISYEYRENVIDKLMEKLIPEKFSCMDTFYLTTSEIKEMSNEGMIIGSHTVSHRLMSKLDIQIQELEIKESFKVLNNFVEKFDVKTFCYPYGGFHSFSKETEKILKRENCLFSFNVESRDVNESDIRLRNQALPRYDCNEFPYGKCKT